MKICRKTWLTLFLLNGLAFGQVRIPAQTTAPAANPLVEGVRTAPDPSSTIAAYISGIVAVGPAGAVELERAYVHRIFALGAPELGDAQAHELIGRGAADVTIRGVAAYNDAVRGNARTAIVNLTVGLAERPDDPFLLRTAGQVVAWHDAQGGRSKLSPQDIAGIEWLRATGNGRQAFADAYRVSAEARRPQPQAAATALPAPPTPAMAATSTTQPTSGQANSAASYQSTSYPYDSSSGGYRSSDSGYGYSYPYSGSYGYSAYSGYASGSSADSLLTLRDRDYQRVAEGLDPRGIAGDGRPFPPPVNPTNGPGQPFPNNPFSPGPMPPAAQQIPQGGGAAPTPSPDEFRMPQGPAPRPQVGPGGPGGAGRPRGPGGPGGQPMRPPQPMQPPRPPSPPRLPGPPHP
jgi:hypothetical protein